MYKFKRFLAFLVGFGSAMGAVSIATETRPISLGLIFSGLYFLFVVTDIKNAPNIGKMFGRYYLYPLVYILLLWIMNMLYATTGGLHFPTSLFLNWVLMFFILLHSCADTKAVNHILTGVSIGAVIMSILFYLGYGLEYQSTIDGERVSIFGMNGNDVCITQSIGLCVLLNEGIIRNNWRLNFARWLLIIPIILQITMVLALASRTGVIIVALVLTISLLTIQGMKRSTRTIIILIGSVLIGYGVYTLFQSDSVIVTRLLRVVDEGDTSGRTDIWSAYLRLFPEHPVFGVGETGLIDVCRRAGLSTIQVYGHEMAFSPHNVLVEVLMTTGLVGLFLMLKFWIKTFTSAYKGYRLNHITTAIILVIPIVIVILSGQILLSKIAWSLYAYMIIVRFQTSIECNT